MSVHFGDPIYVEAIPEVRETREIRPRPNPLLVSPADAAVMLGTTPRTIYRLAKRGEFRILKFGSRSGIPYGELLAYLDRLPSLYGPKT